MGLHELHGLFDASLLADGNDGRGHHLADGRALRITAVEHHAQHQVAFAEDTAQVLPIEDQNGTHVEFRHLPGHIGHSLALLGKVELSIRDDVSDSGHISPLSREWL